MGEILYKFNNFARDPRALALIFVVRHTNRRGPRFRLLVFREIDSRRRYILRLFCKQSLHLFLPHEAIILSHEGNFCYIKPAMSLIQLVFVRYSPCRAFKMELNEVNDQAGQREVIAENLQANVLRELNILVKDFKEDRKKHLQEGARLMATLAGQIGNLERARKAYEKAFREAERAVENYQRADADLNLSRAEVCDTNFSFICQHIF